MPRKTRRRGRRKAASRSRNTRRQGQGRRGTYVLGRLLILGLILTGAYVAWLDLHVRSQFEGRRWSVPARIYARAVELYPGMRLEPEALEQALRAAGYQARAGAGRNATYARRGNTFHVHTRPFRFWDGEQSAQRVRLEFRTGRVSDLQVGGEQQALVRLDPPIIGRIYPNHREDRMLVRLEEVPVGLVAALLSVEDRDFEHHHGISPRAIARALLANLRAGALVQGGSTITQQLAKGYFLNGARTWWRKLNDAVIALMLEAHYDKADFLEAYVNEVYLGQDGERAIHGFGLAAHFYFGRDLDKLRLPELALLVALVRGPSHYNPRRHPRRALARRNLVIDQMHELGIVSAARAKRARAAPLGVIAASPVRTRYPAFVDLVRRQLRRDYRDEDLRGEGLRIFTTLDLHTQRMAERALESRIARLERAGGRRKGSLQGAVIVTSPQSGEVLAVVGGRNERRAGFNRALDAVRPVGSLIKPAVFLAALERSHLALRGAGEVIQSRHGQTRHGGRSRRGRGKPAPAGHRAAAEAVSVPASRRRGALARGGHADVPDACGRRLSRAGARHSRGDVGARRAAVALPAVVAPGLRAGAGVPGGGGHARRHEPGNGPLLPGAARRARGRGR
jgi:penicillin-binding protein 1B